MVVAERAQHWLHRHLHLRLLCFLLSKPILYEWPCTKHRVLWLFSAHSDGLLIDAGQCVVLGFTGIYTLHLP